MTPPPPYAVVERPGGTLRWWIIGSPDPPQYRAAVEEGFGRKQLAENRAALYNAMYAAGWRDRDTNQGESHAM